jgi:hypothetical protein
MDSEQRKEYNKVYYEKNKDVIKSKVLKKVTCPLCNRQVNHQNLQRHQQTKLCLSRRCLLTSEGAGQTKPKLDTDIKPDLTELLQILKELAQIHHLSQAQPVDV